jgi:hypothetical protein
LPAPVEGWDTESPFGELPLTRATVIDNWIPRGSTIEIRNGYAGHATGMTDPVEALVAYNGGAVSKMFAATATDVYEVTSAGAVGSAEISSLTNGRWVSVNISTSGGAYLWMCNGADDPRTYDGSSWAVPVLTMPAGFTDNDILYVCESKQRLFFVLKDSLTFGYLPVDTIAGTVASYPLGSVFGRGGKLIAIATMTHDGGAGPDDYTVFLTDQGEVAIFQGVNPGGSGTWSLVGRWYVGEPCGYRPFVDLDGDVGVITLNGVVPISQAFAAHEVIEPPRFLTARISTPFRARASAGRSFAGWQGLYYPAGDLLIVNVPTATSAEQYVRAQITGGWTRFTGIPAVSWLVFDGALYFGCTCGNVWKYTGFADDGGDIEATLQTAWTSLGASGVVKRCTAVRPIVTTATGAEIAFVARTDFRSDPPLPSPDASTLTNGLVWGTGVWGTNVWGGLDEGARQWRSLSGVGHTIALVMQVKSNQSRVALQGIDLIVEPGTLF